jgi:hypothetical protein
MDNSNLNRKIKINEQNSKGWIRFGTQKKLDYWTYQPHDNYIIKIK